MHETVTKITIVIKKEDSDLIELALNVMALIRGRWPALQSWHISGMLRNHLALGFSNPKLDSDGVAMLAKGNLPQLRFLSIVDGKATPSFMEALSKSRWPNSELLSMSFLDLNHARLRRLSAVQWSQLTNLDLSYQQSGCWCDRRSDINILAKSSPFGPFAQLS